MYFTHDNLVKFVVEVLDLKGLIDEVWWKANHPDDRLPYVIDPACGSGTFLLHAMSAITATVKDRSDEFSVDFDSEQFVNARLNDEQPNYGLNVLCMVSILNSSWLSPRR